MKQLIVVEAMKPLQVAEKAQKALRSAMSVVMAITRIRKIWTKVKK